MEKIQAAIAKARAERERKVAAEAAAPAAQEIRPSAPADPVVPAAPEPERPRERQSAPRSEPLSRPADQAAPTAPPETPPAAAPASEPPLRQFEVPAISPDIVAAWQELPSFAPKPRAMARQRIVSFGGTDGSAEIDMLRTRVLQQMRIHGWRRLAITSPGRDCGKSTVALNLAFSLSRQSDLRTIVCDMDLKRPALAGILGLKGSRSFARVLQGETSFRAEAVRARPNLAFGVTESRVRNSAELLQGPMIGQALSNLSRNYAPDVMIFDMPAMLSRDDTMAFLGHVDCVLLVAGAGSTSLREVDSCEADLAQQTNVLGVVLNKCRYMDRRHA